MPPSEIIDQMMQKDAYSQWLGIERVEEGEGYCCLQLVVREDMLNGFGIAHGGISYSLADSALAFASNSRGKHALSIDTGISHLLPVFAGDILLARTEEQHVSNRIAQYQVIVSNQKGQQVAIFKGIVFRKEKHWETQEEITSTDHQ